MAEPAINQLQRQAVLSGMRPAEDASAKVVAADIDAELPAAEARAHES